LQSALHSQRNDVQSCRHILQRTNVLPVTYFLVLLTNRVAHHPMLNRKYCTLTSSRHSNSLLRALLHLIVDTRATYRSFRIKVPLFPLFHVHLGCYLITISPSSLKSTDR